MCRFIFPKFNFKIEKWKWNEEYRVYVSSLGHFKDEHKRNIPVKISSKTGYCNIITACGYKVAHRLVLLTFRPIPNAEDLTVDHLNHNKRDNSLSNLEWVTLNENRTRAEQDLYKDNQIISNNWTNKSIKAGELIFNNMAAAIDYVYEQSANNGSEPSRGRIEHKILNVLNKDKLYMKRKWKTINK